MLNERGEIAEEHVILIMTRNKKNGSLARNLEEEITVET
jgi:hypothetical protein